MTLYLENMYYLCPNEAHQNLYLTASRNGTAEAVMRWLHLDFGAGLQFENRPPLRSSWQPQLHILPNPKPVSVGDIVEISIYHSRYGMFVISQA